MSGVNPAIAGRQGDTFAQELDRFLAHKRNELKPRTFANVEYIYASWPNRCIRRR